MDKTSVSLLQQSVKNMMSEKRYIHTVGVMEMAQRLADFCLPEKKLELSCAALLHDIAKELSDDELTDIIKKSYEDSEKIISYDRQVWHSFAAPYVIESVYSEFAISCVLSSTQKHTVGSEDMSVFDEIIFISDYIEMGRTYSACVAVREYLLGQLKDGEPEQNIQALHRACVMAIEYTVENLKSRGKIICTQSLLAKNALLTKIKK